ncbi:hypothetical protein [Lapidilactobacillus dextrinicus]|uniref:hypothetical protein n=1 Tax=Lapidilactobacillus dextrinicus TaxID=51664 RepID=UPI003F2366B5
MIISFDIEKIPNRYTKEYLLEVISSLNNNNLRSAVVMLYSVILTDLCAKLKTLDEIYDDSSARKILQNLREKDLKDPSRESGLIEEIRKTKPELLSELADITIDQVKELRNLCAHPSLNDDTAEPLPHPNSYTVCGLIQSCIDNIFIFPANLGSKIFGPMLDDLSDNTEFLQNDSALKNFLNIRYLNRFNRATRDYVLEQLFKEVFCKNGEDEIQNRDLNFRTLLVMIKNDEQYCVELIAASVYFKQQMLIQNASIIKIIADFFQTYPILFEKSEEYIRKGLCDFSDLKKGLKQFIENYYLDSKLLSDHLKNNLTSIIESIETDSAATRIDDDFSAEDVQLIFDRLHYEDKLAIFFDLSSRIYAESRCFNSADYRFGIWITPFIQYYDKTEILQLIERVNPNNQCTKRGLSQRDHPLILDKYKELDPDNITDAELKEQWPFFCIS